MTLKELVFFADFLFSVADKLVSLDLFMAMNIGVGPGKMGPVFLQRCLKREVLGFLHFSMCIPIGHYHSSQ